MEQVNHYDLGDVKNLFIANLNGVSSRSISKIACLISVSSIISKDFQAKSQNLVNFGEKITTKVSCKLYFFKK